MDTAGQLSVRGLWKSYGRPILQDVDLDVRAGAINVLMGSNGAGKTTLFNVVSGFVRPERGRVELEGRSLLGLPAHRVARLGVARLFQDVRVFPTLTLLDNVLVGAPSLGEVPGLGLVRFRAARAQARDLEERAWRLLEYVGLPDGRRYAEQLSFGQQKRLALARLLISEPRLLMLDEPSAGLDPGTVVELVQLINRLAGDGRTIWVIEHNREVVRELGGRVSFMAAGRIAAQGEAADILADDRVAELCLVS